MSARLFFTKFINQDTKHGIHYPEQTRASNECSFNLVDPGTCVNYDD